ncbi:MAG: M48 family metallopeptidase [Spirochaetes bacterium]|nr:M48 family metallopeptidase [Spirochaetota bacterium]
MKNLFLKQLLFSILLISLTLFMTACTTNPFTGKRTMAFVSNDALFAEAALQYRQFLSENTVITGTPEARMVAEVGNRIRLAAEKWAASMGQSRFLQNYQWEFNLIESDVVNAWVMPGGKIVFYSGILPVTRDADGLAVVMGHEVAHAILNHGQQRVSASVLQQVGAVGVAALFADRSPTMQELAMASYAAGTSIFGTLPFSRAQEIEADRVGLILMIIAGYNPEAAVDFWERMHALAGGGGIPQFLSTHPSSETRIADLKSFMPEAKRRAAEIGIMSW